MQVIYKPRSTWEVLTFQPRKVEVRFFDPLKVKVGATVRINTLDLQANEFHLDSISEYTRQINGQTFVFTDYNLSFKPIGADRISIRLRVVPTGNKADEGQDYNILLLRTDYEQGYDDNIGGVLQDAENNKKFIVSDDKDGVSTSDEYFRMNDLSEAYVAAVATLVDTNNDGKFDDSEVTSGEVWYLDFGREVPTAAEGITETEMYFVEKNTKTGWVTMLKGNPINENRVTVI